MVHHYFHKFPQDFLSESPTVGALGEALQKEHIDSDIKLYFRGTSVGQIDPF